MTITGIRGFNDILPNEAAAWRRMEEEAERVFSSFGFLEIRLPVVEKTELFLRTIGETTDIVEKQMYSFLDRHGESLTLRPEGTAPLVRAYIEHKLYSANSVSRLFYRGAMFRYERPQKGRYRQFYQLGAEVLGEESPMVDAEALNMLSIFLARLGIKGTSIEVNSLGCIDCRPAYKEELKGFLSVKKENLCENCSARTDKNPLRALDCKNPSCVEAVKDAPLIQGFLCDGCKGHFEGLKKGLDAFGVSFRINPKMVRGLDYYTRTTFEVLAKDGLGSQNAVAAGGRYDGLVKELGGPKTPCFGFAIGMERLAALFAEGSPAPERAIVYCVFMNDEAKKKGFILAAFLREKGESVIVDYGSGALKDAFKRSDKAGARFTLIIGSDELRDGVVTLKDMKTGAQEKIKQENLVLRFNELKGV
ncbi:MAG TPA: histidine--tRNA ligase [Thermodesulfobacteriota bacterium]|nr:histidine--tRNA ligase [Thermodesulfobacteriota bacterium]